MPFASLESGLPVFLCLGLLMNWEAYFVYTSALGVSVCTAC